MHDPGDHAPFPGRRPAPAGPRPGGPCARRAVRRVRRKGAAMTPYAVVIPTLVRDTLADCLAALAARAGRDRSASSSSTTAPPPRPTPTRRPWSTR